MKRFRLFLTNYAAHIAVLLVGTGILLGGCFQDNLWFDEAYTVGMMRLDLPDLLYYSAFDVHPQLYYLMLKGVVTVFGDSLVVMRLFSVLGMVLFASLGLTHIRRDFGKQVGFWFSFCTMFSGVAMTYALQIRMYSWVMYFVGLAAIYCYRMYANPDSRKDRWLFILSSLCAAYTHYYGLFAVAALNLLLLYGYVRKKRPLVRWFIDGGIQIGGYLPGLYVFLVQLSAGGATWMKMKWPDMVFDFVSYPLLGDVPQTFAEYGSGQYSHLGGVMLAIFVAGGILLHRFYKQNRFPTAHKTALKAALYAYFGILLVALAVSLFRPLYHVRYTVVIFAFLAFAVALLFASFKKKLSKCIAAVLVLLFFTGQGLYQYDVIYDSSSDAVQEAMGTWLQDDDCFLIDGDTLNGLVVATMYPDTAACFYNNAHWNVQNAYKCFRSDLQILDELETEELSSLPSRVWVFGKKSSYEKLIDYGYQEAEHHVVQVRYRNSKYSLYLMTRS